MSGKFIFIFLVGLFASAQSFMDKRYGYIHEVTKTFVQELGCECIVMWKSKYFVINEIKEINYLGTNFAKNYSMPVVINNFEDYLNSGNPLKSCYNPLNLILPGETSKKYLNLLSWKYLLIKSIWLTFVNNSSMFDFNSMRIPLNSQFYIASTETSLGTSGLILSEVYQIGRNNSLVTRINEIGMWNEQFCLCHYIYSVNRRRNNLGEIQIWAGTETGVPQERQMKRLTIEGFVSSVWVELSATMNFTTVILRSIDGHVGVEDANGEWSGLIGMLHRGEIDIAAVDMDLSPERLDIVDTLLPILRTRYRVFYRFDGYVSDPWSVFRPFSPSVWLILIFWILGVSVALHAAGFLISYIKNDDNGYGSPLESVLFVFQALSSQGSKAVPSVWTSRIIFVTCYLTTTVLLPCYSASLISFLTKKTPARPYTMLSQMTADNYRINVLENSIEYTHFQKSNDPIFQEVFRKTLDTLKSETYSGGQKVLYELVCGLDSGVFMSEATMNTLIRNFKLCNPVTLNKRSIEFQQTFGFPKNSPYTDLFNWNILRMREFGIERRMHRKYVVKMKEIDFVSTPDVAMSDLSHIFLGLAFGQILSICLLLFEIMAFRWYGGYTCEMSVSDVAY